jgi:CxxC motif-containing protein (DUF1111 family)
MKRKSILAVVIAALAGAIILSQDRVLSSETPAHDPGVRAGTTAAPMPIPGLTTTQLAAFAFSLDNFLEEEKAADGLGPTMNLDSCSGCHAFPVTGGTSPATNPQVAFANLDGATNTLPHFITSNGPVREARFVRNPDGTPDGGVHDLFTITGRADAPGCNIAQPDFATAAATHNVIFRIPTPLFGAGLIEQIPDSAIVANLAANSGPKNMLGIRGHANMILAGHTISGQLNHNGNDGTIARFGWKAQNKSLLLFAGEAYNVEMGITNEIFQTERNETLTCQFSTVPNSVTDFDGTSQTTVLSDIEKFATFMRFLAPPAPSTSSPGGAASIASGKTDFANVGCSLCHSPTLTTGNSTVAALRNQPANLYSDLALHDMGSNLADGVSQGQASGSEFRTAPLWGLGQRIFFLHDGRTSDLLDAIAEHKSPGVPGAGGSEANAVVDRFSRLTEAQKQDLLNFLRSL